MVACTLSLCQDAELAIMNGRVDGDSPAGVTCCTNNTSKSTIDLYYASTGLFQQASGLRVMQSPLWGHSRVLSDHTPVSLSLACEWQPVVARVRHFRQRRTALVVPKFDLSLRNRYTVLFADGGHVQDSIAELTTALDHNCSSNTSIEGIHALLKECCKTAFGGTDTCAQTQVQADWWSDECARALNTIIAFRESIGHASGPVPEAHVDAFKGLRTAYNRTRKRAMSDWKVRALGKRIQEAHSGKDFVHFPPQLFILALRSSLRKMNGICSF